MKVTLSQLIAADRFMDRCGLSFINNLVNSLLKIYLRCTGKESLTGSTLKRDWSIYVKQKDAASCAAGFIPLLGSILIVAKERFNENRADAVMCQLLNNSESIFDLDDSQKEKLSYSSIYSASLANNNLHNKIRFDQRFKLGGLQREEEALEYSMYSEIGCDKDDAENEVVVAKPNKENAQAISGQTNNLSVPESELLCIGPFPQIDK
jgi:hypothetical protein